MKNFGFLFLAFLFSTTLLAQKVPVQIKTATGYYNRALAEFGYNDIDAAIENCNQAIALKADYADALSYRGYFYKLKNELDKAITDYQAANKLKNNINGYFMAVPYALKGNKDEAFKWLEVAMTGPENKPTLETVKNDVDLQSLQSDPRWTTFIQKEWFTPYEKLVKEANEKTAAGDFAAAIPILTKAIKSDMANDIAYGQRALNYFRLNDFSSAVIDLTMAINLNSKSSTYYGNRAYMYSKLNKNTEALADYNKAIQLDPQNMVYADRAMLKEKINQFDPGVAEDLKSYLDAFYKDDFNAFILGSNYFINGNYTNAISYLTQAINIKGEADYYKLRGKAYFANKANDKSVIPNAIMDFDKVISMKSNDGEAYYFRGMSKAEQMNKEGACSDWRRAESLGYADPNGYINAICK